MDPSVCITAFEEIAEFSEFIWVFPKWNRTFAEFSEFTETDKSLKHELGSI